MSFILSALAFILFFLIMLFRVISDKVLYRRDRREASLRAERMENERIESEKADRLFKLNSWRKIFPVKTDDPIQNRKWGVWREDIHDRDAQIDRQKRAHAETLPLIIDPDDYSSVFLSTANSGRKIYHTYLNKCSCPDFHSRNLPCKHMYRLFYECQHKDTFLFKQDKELQAALNALTPDVGDTLHDVIAFWYSKGRVINPSEAWEKLIENDICTVVEEGKVCVAEKYKDWAHNVDLLDMSRRNYIGRINS